MNRQRFDTIASLLLLVIVIVCFVGIGRYFFVSREIDRMEAEDSRQVIGTDQVLLETVQGLENTLRERISYQFVSKNDPLDLTKVITSRDFLHKLGADRKDPDSQEMRLAATVVGEDGSAAAVVRYLGSGHVLRAGDEIEGWKVREITPEAVTLVRGGEKKVLVNRPIRETLQATGMMLSVRPMMNDDYVRSMYTNVGFPGDVMPSSAEDTGEEMESPKPKPEAVREMMPPAEALPDTTDIPADSTESGNR